MLAGLAGAEVDKLAETLRVRTSLTGRDPSMRPRSVPRTSTINTTEARNNTIRKFHWSMTPFKPILTSGPE